MKQIIAALIWISISNPAWAALPVAPASDQTRFLKSADARLAANKRLVYDFARIILAGHRLDQAANFLREDYLQHNPNVETGLKGFLDFISKFGGPRAVPKTIDGLVSITAEGDLVTMSFVNELKDTSGQGYTTTWFDMFRIQEGKIAEHWDCDTKPN